MEELIRAGLAQLNIPAPPEVPALLARYGELLLEKNKVMNLTAITEPQDVASLHMLDCAALLSCGEFGGRSLIDVGSGAGFPGMVLGALVPTLEVTLLDALNKRVDWLARTREELGLKNVRAAQGRAEEGGRDPALREQFDFAAARAVAELRVLCELCLPFVKVGGRFLAMKSVECGQELEKAQSALSALGGRLVDCRDYAVPGTQVIHRAVLVEKIAPTPFQYPRRWAKIQKDPL